MQTLKEMKQKGRTLRKHLEAAFGTKVSLSQAYEALAKMEGATDWNTLSAQLAKTEPPCVVSAVPGRLEGVFDIDLGLPRNRQLLTNVCATIWQGCVARWTEHNKTHSSNEYIIESTDIFEGMSQYSIISTGEDGFADEAERLVEAALDELGYHSQAARIYGRCAQLGDAVPMPDWEPQLHRIADDPRRQVHSVGLELIRGLEPAQKLTALNWLQASAHRIRLNPYLTQPLRVFFVNRDTAGIPDTLTEFFKEAEQLSTERIAFYEADVAPGVSANDIPGATFGYLDVDMTEIVGPYDNPDVVSEWQWVERNARFTHVGNGVEGGVYEFMVPVPDEATLAEEAGDYPVALLPVFQKAVHAKANWVLFNQG